jgi:dihydroxy-acid dehydratase
MDPANQQKQNEPEEPRFLDFPHLPNDATQDGKPRLNKYSSTLTKDHDFPGAQVDRASTNKPGDANVRRQCCTPQACLI